MNQNIKKAVAIFIGALGIFAVLGIFAATSLSNGSTVRADESDDDDNESCENLPDHDELTTELKAKVDDAEVDGGLGNDMWATLVDRDGVVCAVTMSGDDRGDQWPGSRVISSQKANTANAFSLPDGAKGFDAPLSTAQLWTATQPGGSLFGLQFSNPVDTEVAYGGDAEDYGTDDDPMVGEKIGGVNVFGGGLAAYDSTGKLVGAIGLSGDTSCADHILAWKVRDALGLDFVTFGVNDLVDDNMIIVADGVGFVLALEGAFSHPSCNPVALGGDPDDIVAELPLCYPIGAVVGPVSGAGPLTCP